MTVRALGTLAALSFVKNSMLDETGTVVSASPWMKIVGAKFGPMYVVGDAALIASGVAWPSGHKPVAICALASGYTPMHALTFELTPGVPTAPSNSALS